MSSSDLDCNYENCGERKLARTSGQEAKGSRLETWNEDFIFSHNIYVLVLTPLLSLAHNAPSAVTQRILGTNNASFLDDPVYPPRCYKRSPCCIDHKSACAYSNRRSANTSLSYRNVCKRTSYLGKSLQKTYSWSTKGYCEVHKHPGCTSHTFDSFVRSPLTMRLFAMATNFETLWLVGVPVAPRTANQAPL